MMALSEHDKQRLRDEEEFRQSLRNETATQAEADLDRKAKANPHSNVLLWLGLSSGVLFTMLAQGIMNFFSIK